MFGFPSERIALYILSCTHFNMYDIDKHINKIISNSSYKIQVILAQQLTN
jgi:hypothetical protein